MEHQKDLSLRRGESISDVRMDAVNKETMDHYFLLLKDTLDEHNLLDKPEQIYNVDKSGLSLDPKAPKAAEEKERRRKDRKDKKKTKTARNREEKAEGGQEEKESSKED